MSTIINFQKKENIFYNAVDFTTVTANAGDKVILCVHGHNGSSMSPFTWNGQTATEIADVSGEVTFFKVWELIASSNYSGLLLGNFGAYCYYNTYCFVVRPTTSFNNTLSVTNKSWYHAWISGGLGSFAQPSLTSGALGTNGRVLDFLAVIGRNTADTDLRPTTVTTSTTLNDSALHPYILVNRTDSSTSTSTGAVTSSYTIPTGIQYMFVQLEIKESSVSITSINGGNPVTVGQTGVAIVSSGFTSKPTSVVGTFAGGTISATVGAGTTNNFVIDIQDVVDATPWPLDGANVSWAFSNGSESGSAFQAITKKAGELVQTFIGAVTTDPAYITYHIAGDGFAVNGGEFIYPTALGVVDTDGTNHTTSAGVYVVRFRPASGTGAGNVYLYTFTLNDAGQVVGSAVIKLPSLCIGFGIGI
jgi:hypothetical protein